MTDAVSPPVADDAERRGPRRTRARRRRGADRRDAGLRLPHAAGPRPARRRADRPAHAAALRHALRARRAPVVRRRRRGGRRTRRASRSRRTTRASWSRSCTRRDWWPRTTVRSRTCRAATRCSGCASRSRSPTRRRRVGSPRRSRPCSTRSSSCPLLVVFAWITLVGALRQGARLCHPRGLRTARAAARGPRHHGPLGGLPRVRPCGGGPPRWRDAGRDGSRALPRVAGVLHRRHRLLPARSRRTAAHRPRRALLQRDRGRGRPSASGGSPATTRSSCWSPRRSSRCCASCCRSSGSTATTCWPTSPACPTSSRASDRSCAASCRDGPRTRTPGRSSRGRAPWSPRGCSPWCRCCWASPSS